MARGNNRNSGGNRSNRGRNNNPEGRNQYSGGVMDVARERPVATALGAAAAVGAGVFLWSRRNQISDQLSNISDQIGEWTEGLTTGDSEFGMSNASTGSGSGTGNTAQRKSGSRKTQSEISEEALTLKETGAA